jgi:chromosome segregation ATPase
LREEVDYYQFKLKVAEEKDKVHEKNLNQLKELQFEYEEQKRMLQAEYKNKEEKLKKRYEQVEDTTLSKYRDKEKELIENLEKLTNDYTNLARGYDRLEKERDNLKETIIKHDKIIRHREDEFEQVLLAKDSRMKELELYIRSISEEANLQITKLNNSVVEFNEKINFYRSREFDLSQEVIKLQKHAEHSELIELNKSRDYKKTSDMNLLKFQEDNKKSGKAIDDMHHKVKNYENEINVIFFLKFRN